MCSLTFTIFWTESADGYLLIFVLFSPENVFTHVPRRFLYFFFVCVSLFSYAAFALSLFAPLTAPSFGASGGLCPRGGRYSEFCFYVSLAPASSVYPAKIYGISAIPKKSSRCMKQISTPRSPAPPSPWGGGYAFRHFLGGFIYMFDIS